MRIRIRSNARWAILAVAACMAACEGENGLDDTLVVVTELQDVFLFNVTGLDNVTAARRYLWAMTGDQAMVDVTPGLTGGSAFLQIRGGNGEVVYAEDIQSEVDGVTEANIFGLWQIDIVFEKASGEFTIALERDTVP